MCTRNQSSVGLLVLCLFLFSAPAVAQLETPTNVIPVPTGIRVPDWTMWFVADMNGDGADELVYKQMSDGTSTGWRASHWDCTGWVETPERLPEETIFAQLLPGKVDGKNEIVCVLPAEAGGYEYGVYHCGVADKKGALYPDKNGTLARGLAVYGHLSDEQVLNVALGRWTDSAIDAESGVKDLEVYELTVNGPKLLAVSRSHAGLIPVGIADFDADGKAEIAALEYDTERHAMNMRIYFIQDGQLNSSPDATFEFDRETPEVRGVTVAHENGRFVLLVVGWDFLRKLAVEHGKLVEVENSLKLPDGWRGFGAFPSDCDEDGMYELVIGVGRETSDKRTFEYAFLALEQSTENASALKP